MPDEGGEKRIYQFLSLSIYGSKKGDEGADTILMF